MLSSVRRRLGNVRALRRLRWRAGELLHHDLPPRAAAARERLPGGRGGTSDGAGALGASGAPAASGGCGGSDASPSAGVDRFPARLGPAPGVENPVLTARDVTDYGDVDFVADPFLLADDRWHLFFEAFNRDRRPTGVVCHSTSEDGCEWRYDRVVLRDDVHLAFPYAFEYGGSYYMVPDRWDRSEPAAVTLYRTDSLPAGWTPVARPVSPERQLADVVVFRHGGRWWTLGGSDDGRHDLLAYHSDDLEVDGWTPHADNPVVAGRPRASRPAGRPFRDGERLVVPFQDATDGYGICVRPFDLLALSPATYRDRERPGSPVLGGTGGLGWNSGRMHHLDAHRNGSGWLCAVDGNVGLGRSLFGPDHWAVGIYGTRPPTAPGDAAPADVTFDDVAAPDGDREGGAVADGEDRDVRGEPADDEDRGARGGPADDGGPPA